jgi:hypothetical protein
MYHVTLAHKLITLREASLRKIRELGHLDDAVVGQPSSPYRQLPLSYQQQGRIHILSSIVGALADVSDEMLPVQAQWVVKPLLEMLAERKAAGLAFFHRQPRSYRIDHPTEWRIMGELEQIGDVWPQLCACFSPRWQAQPWKHGCHFQVYHYLPEYGSSATETIARWNSASRRFWFEEVALLKVPAFATLNQRLAAVFRSTANENRTHGEIILWAKSRFLRPTSCRDVVVSVLSERAWMVDTIGFRALTVGEKGNHQ